MQGYVDAVLDLASHFITRLRRYASFCRTLASHAVGASSTTSSSRNVVTSPTNNSSSPSNNQSRHRLPDREEHFSNLMFIYYTFKERMEVLLFI
jgi:hypothetical protein